MSSVAEPQQITWWTFINGARRALTYAVATQETLAVVLRHGVDPEFTTNDPDEVVVAYVVPAAVYEALVAGQGS